MYKLLIVEDEDFQRDLYAIELTGRGYEIDTASNGTEAVRMMLRNDYDCVIMDIRMPEMDGIEAMGRIIREEKRTPVIIYTAYDRYKSNFLTWTADAYLTKSSDLTELKEKVAEILEAGPALKPVHH